MHTVSAYQILVSDNSKIGVSWADKQCVLNDIKSSDLLDFFDEFFKNNSDKPLIASGKNVSFVFENVIKDVKERTITLWMRHGKYGIGSQIRDAFTGEHKYSQSPREANLIDHFVSIKLPDQRKSGVLVCHAISGDGIKTDLSEILRESFKNTFGEKMNLKFEPLGYKKALNNWLENGVTKTIRVVGFKKLTDVADELQYGGVGTHEWLMKPPKGKSFGFLKNFFQKGSKERELIKVIEGEAASVKTIVEMDGKKRVFSVKDGEKSKVVIVEIPEDEIILEDGNPVYESIRVWVDDFISDILTDLYPADGGKDE